MTTFQHLLKSSSTRSEAMDVMDDDMFSVPAFCTVGNVIKLLELTENRQINFPIVQDMKTMKIVGSIKRRELFSFLHNMFEKVKRLDDLRKLLPFDADNFDLILRKAEIEEKKKRGILSAFRRESVSIAKSFRISSDSSPSFLSWFSRNRAG
jgi:predicted transcriptional regulator